MDHRDVWMVIERTSNSSNITIIIIIITKSNTIRMRNARNAPRWPCHRCRVKLHTNPLCIHVQPIPYGESFEQISSAPSETCSRRTTQARTHTTNNVIIIEKAYNKGNEQREREAKMKRKKGRKKQRYALRNII
mmetsp:Transcript_9955/g.16670  ORF Transcript_9955/g.16670 Transcript_9955/m.16670 type:complete len:134 (-) Transcript_9955:102-503(-)